MKPYFAIFFKDGDGWGVRFPDADSVHTCGDTIDETLDMAVDALSGMLVVGRKGRDYNEPRSYDEVAREAEQGTLVLPVYPSEKAMETYAPKKRINVMVPVELLEKVNDIVKHTEGLDRSRYFCEAVEEKMAR